jgi:PAS domain S-box-containing protein
VIVSPAERRLLPENVEQAHEHPEHRHDRNTQQRTEKQVREWIHACSIRHGRRDPLEVSISAPRFDVRLAEPQTDRVPPPALKAIAGEIVQALEHINVPSYVIDAAGVIRWVNPAAARLVGDVVGRQFTSIVAPEETRRARELFARKILATSEVTDASIVIVDDEGNRVAVELSSVPLIAGDHVVGVFGQVADVIEEPVSHPELHLTPRQSEVLRLLERGRSTIEIAEELHLSRETVRNHVRHLLQAIGARSRLEAVAVARGEPLTASA